MMENFTQILQQLSTTGKAPSTSRHFISVTPIKVQFNFDIPLFKGHIDVDALEKWLNLLEGYYFVQNHYDTKNITFVLLKSLLHVRDW
jgi:hypothetical protein